MASTTWSRTARGEVPNVWQIAGALRWVVLLPLAMAAAGCAAPPLPHTAAPGAAATPVVVISIDGLRPDAIDAFGLRTLQRLMRDGSYSLSARTVLPSSTLPSHTSMLTGVSPDVHGIVWNRWQRGRGVVGVPTVFELARSRGLHTAAFYAKAKFRHLDRPGSYDHREVPMSNLENWMATDVIPAVARYLAHRRPDLLFVHVSEPDYAGHVTGWMSGIYGRATRRADAAVARILEAADGAYGVDGYTVIVTSDHGGHGRGHGSDDPLDTLIPWMVRGPCADPAAAPTGIRTMDTAATALWLLDIPLPPELDGRPVLEAFSGACRAR